MRRAAALLLAAGLTASASACWRDRSVPEGATAEEIAAFSPPADSSLRADQIDPFLRTSLDQFQRIASEADPVRAAMAEANAARRAPVAPGTPRPRSAAAIWGDFVDGAFVRSARNLGYNPAEMLYVRARLGAAHGHLLASRMHGSRDQAAALFRQQAEAMRGAPGVTQDQVDAMLRAAEQAERQGAVAPSRSVAQNLGTLRGFRPSTADSVLAAVASVAAGSDLAALAQADPPAAAAALARLEAVFRSVLEPVPSGAARGG